MKILIIDDHSVVRAGVRRLLSTITQASMLEASTAEEALPIVREWCPDVILLDLALPRMSGLDLLRCLVEENDRIRVVVFSMHAEPVYAVRALKLGAVGYVSKSACADELLTAVSRVAEGGRYVESEIASELAFTPAHSEDPLRQLSAREIEIIRLLREGLSLTEISHSMGLAYKTIANTCSNLKSKLGLQRKADLIRLTMEIKEA
jgi:DNA-binding NarL/FixJ family response regulator